MSKLNAEQMLQRAHVQLMQSPQYCLLSGIIMCGKSTISDAAPTAYTDGWNKVYGREFFTGLSDKERNFVVAHENFHVLLKQLTTWQALFKKDARRCNMAADYCINQMIVDLDPKGVVAAAPDSLLLDAQYRGMNTKQIFDLLIADGGRGSGEGDTLDDHGWEEAVQGEEEMRDREKAIDIAIRQGAILAGKMGSGGARVLADLLEPKVDWREQLRDFVTASTSGRDLSTWRRPNRRYLSQGVYMPSSQSESVGHIVVAIDTSGSVGGRELSAFVSELVSICDTVKPDKVTLLWWDTEVCGEQAFEGDYSGMVNQLKPQGGGGTRFECVTVYLDQNRIVPDCLITLTDGYVSQWGSAPHYPSLFGITSKESAPFGVTVRVEGE